MPSITRRHLAENMRSSAKYPVQHSAAADWHMNVSSTTTRTSHHDKYDDYEYHHHRGADDDDEYYYYYYEDYGEHDAHEGVRHSSQHTTSRTSTSAPAANKGRE